MIFPSNFDKKMNAFIALYILHQLNKIVLSFNHKNDDTQSGFSLYSRAIIQPDVCSFQSSLNPKLFVSD